MKDRLKELRLKAGLTQAQLADKAAHPVRWVQRIESGDILLENITLRNAKSLAAALGCSLDDLIK